MSNEDFKISVESEITSAAIVKSDQSPTREKSEVNEVDVTLVMKEDTTRQVDIQKNENAGYGNGNGNDKGYGNSNGGSDGGDGDGDGGDGNSSPQPKKDASPDEKKRQQEEKYRRTVARAFETAESMLNRVKDGQGLDIYQYCAFLSKNAYHVAPKSKSLKKDDNNDEDDEDEEDNPDFIPQDTNDLNASQHDRKRSTLRSTDLLRKAVNRKYRVTKVMYYIGMAKALLVAGLQLISLLVAMTELIEENYNPDAGETFCTDRFEFKSAHQTIKKTLFAGFCALIAINVTGLIKDLGTSGMYSTLFRNECLVPDLIDQGWLIAGRTVNYLVLISSTWASFLIIFFSRNVLDMVINSVAIFFVLQLDNMVVGREHYKIVENYLDVYEWNIGERVDSHIRKKNNQITEEEKNNREREWNIFKLLFDFITWILSTAVVTPAVFLTSFLAFIFVPAFILVCAQ